MRDTRDWAQLGRRLERAKFFMWAANHRQVPRGMAEAILLEYDRAVECMLRPASGGEQWDKRRK